MASTAPSSQRQVGSSTQECPLKKCSVLIQVMRQDTKEYVGGATVQLDGPTAGSGQTAGGNGAKSFDPVDPGAYHAKVTLEGKLAQEFKAPMVPDFTIQRGEQKVVLVEVRSINHWIEIVLTDMVGKPAAGERYRLVLPDQQTLEGKLDARGRARVERLESGQCKLTFPDLDPDAWEKL